MFFNRYESMTRIYYRGARAAIVCYDLTDPEAWDKVEFWISELQKFEEGCRIYLCATKSDLIASRDAYGSKSGGDARKRRAVDYHSAVEYAEKVGAAALVETSAKTGENVEELFLKVRGS